MEAGTKVEEQQDRLAGKQAEAEMRVPTTSPPGSHYHSHLKCAALLAGCLLLLYCTYLFRDYIHAVLLWTEHQPPAVVLLIFVALFTLVSLPLAWGYIVVNLACGYLFGFGHGLIVTVVTATVGVLLAHLIITYCLAGQVRRLLATSEYTRSLYTVITGPQAFKLVVLTRLTPVPFGLQNAVFSVSNLPCGRYLAASVLGLFPTQCINVYMGSTLRRMGFSSGQQGCSSGFPRNLEISNSRILKYGGSVDKRGHSEDGLDPAPGSTSRLHRPRRLRHPESQGRAGQGAGAEP